MSENKVTSSSVILGNSFLKNVLLLASGTLGAQFLTIIASPILTRLYSPNDFGLLAIFASFLAISLVVTTLRYELAIPLPEDNEDAENVFFLSLIIHCLSVIFLLILIYFFQNFFADKFGFSETPWFLWFFPIGVFFSGLYSILIQWNVREKKFKRISFTKIFRILVTLSIQLFGSFFGGISLILGHLLGSCTGVTSLSKPKLNRITVPKVMEMFVQFKRFPKFSMLAGLFRVGGTELPIFFLAFLFSSTSAGLYALTMRVLGAPASLVGTAVAQVFISDAPNANREGKLPKLVQTISRQLIHLGAPCALIIILIGPELFSFVFGSDWREAGRFASWLSVWIYLVFISSPLTTLTTVLEKQKQGLYFHSIMFFARGAALSVGMIIENVMYTIFALSTVNTLGRLYFVCWLYKISGNDPFEFLLENIKALFISSLLITPLLFNLIFIPSFWFVGLLFSVLLLCLRYMYLFKYDFR